MSQESALCVLRSPPLRPEMCLQIPLIAQYSGYATRELNKEIGSKRQRIARRARRKSGVPNRNPYA